MLTQIIYKLLFIYLLFIIISIIIIIIIIDNFDNIINNIDVGVFRTNSYMGIVMVSVGGVIAISAVVGIILTATGVCGPKRVSTIQVSLMWTKESVNNTDIINVYQRGCQQYRYH